LVNCAVHASVIGGELRFFGPRPYMRLHSIRGPSDGRRSARAVNSPTSTVETTMTRSLVLAALVMSTAALTPSLAQAQVSEPAAYQSQHPDRDILNGGQLTPAGQAARGAYVSPSAAYASQGQPAPAAPVVRRRHQRQ
jgi:hypothetical protein